MPLIRQYRIYRHDLRANPDVLYIFGDNEERVGRGGQAVEMRDEPNAVGIATLASPGDYWRPEDTARQCAVIDADMAPLFAAAKAGKLIVYPLDGVGTGLAHLESEAPNTFKYLQEQIAKLEAMANG